MLNANVDAITKIAVGIALFIGAGKIAWLGRNYDGLAAGFMVPTMCLLVAFTFSLTAFALILRSEE